MPEGIEDNRGPLGRAHSGGGAAKQDSERGDSDRGYGARDGQREQGGADRGGGDGDGDGDGVPEGGVTPSQYTGTGGARTDQFGARDDQRGDDAAGWREVGAAGPDEHLGGEDERPG